jgi:KUP system potassium uptake protein
VEDEESVVVRTATAATDGNNSDTLQSLLQNMYESESRWFANRRRVRLDLKHAGEHVDPRMKKDLSAIMEAKHAGMLHIMDHSYIKEGRAPMCLRSLPSTTSSGRIAGALNAVAFNVSHISIIEVSMIYYIQRRIYS